MIEKDHLGDWSPEEDCMLFVTDVSTTCAEAIVRVKILHLTLKMASAQVVKTSVTNNSPSQGFLIFCRDVSWLDFPSLY